MDLQTIVRGPSEPHTHTVVFLHGRGDNVRNFTASLAWSPDRAGISLIDNFPSFRWVFPQAKSRPAASDYGDMWNQWFDVWNVKDFKDREELQTVGLKESVPSIRKILTQEAELLGGRWDRVILAGISQGAATAAHTLLNLNVKATSVTDGQNEVPPRLCAFLGFSCRMPFAGRSLDETRSILSLADVPDHDQLLRNTPILLEHCVDDPLVGIDHGRQLRDTLRGFGAQVDWKEYPTGAHWFNSPAGIEDAMRFLKDKISDTAADKTVVENSKSKASGDVMDLS